ncbi:MAG TPA: LPS-assembly protein LptD [Burkholderiales bacterium]
MAVTLVLACGASLAWPQAPAKAPAKKPGAPSSIEAESIEGVSELEVTARGKVEFKREELTVYAEFLRYNQEFGRIEADGGVRVQRGVDRFFGPRLRYNTRDDTGVFEQSNYILHGEVSTMRGKAERMEFLGKNRLRLVQGSFTTCEPDKEDWRFEAGEMDIDQDAQRGTVRDGRLKFFDTTVLPVPYGSFSLDSQRKTGFLSPYYGNNSRRGFTVAAPYYWNIAPEQDLTLTPIEMTKRGLQLKTEYRYIDHAYKGELHYEVLPHDQVLNTSRTALTWQHEHQITPALSGRIDFNKVSDDRYFVDLTSNVRTVSQGVLQQMGSLSWGGGFAGIPVGASAMLQRWQTLQDPLAPITPPYARLPQINFGATKADVAGRFDLTLPVEYVRFGHPTLVDGARVQLNPTVAAPYLAPGYFFTPKVGAHYANYGLRNFAPGTPESQSVTVPWMSLDGGLIFDRSTSWFGQSMTQTLEPRVFYVYAPNRNQNAVPLFDTGLSDFNYAQIFTENRFAGGDRFGDANQITLAATSRLVSPAGSEILRATIGQRYYFEDERVGLTPTSVLRTRGQSDLLASIGGRPARNLSFDASVQYNPQESRTERAALAARYAPEIAKVISAGYRYNRETNIRQVDVAGQWPLATGWYAVGRVNYSIVDARLLEGIGGLEYNAGCWVFRGIVQRLQAATATTSTGFFLQLELNGLGSLGSDDIVTLLKRNVPGYVVTNPTESRLTPPSMRQSLPFQQTY